MRNFDKDPPSVSIIPSDEVGAALRAEESGHGKADTRSAPSRRHAKASKDRPVRDAGERRYVHSGMSEAEVATKLGRPDMTARSGGKGRLRWSYLPAPSDPDTITTVYFDRGTVVDVERKVVKR